MSPSLPVRASLEWLKKLCKDRLKALRAQDPAVRLNSVQFAVAREFGFASWRKLKEHVDRVQRALAGVAPADPAESPVAPEDADLARLFAAIAAGDLALVIQLLQQRPILVRSRDREGMTPLHAAAQCNDPRLGMFLLAYGADADATFGESGHTALSWAVTCHALEFAAMLIKVGTDADLFCAAGIGALEAVRGCFAASGRLAPGAVRTGSSRYAEDGTRLECPPPTERERVSDALYIACRNGQVEVARFLLTKQPDLSFRAFMGGARCTGRTLAVRGR